MHLWPDIALEQKDSVTTVEMTPASNESSSIDVSSSSSKYRKMIHELSAVPKMRKKVDLSTRSRH